VQGAQFLPAKRNERPHPGRIAPPGGCLQRGEALNAHASEHSALLRRGGDHTLGASTSISTYTNIQPSAPVRRTTVAWRRPWQPPRSRELTTIGWLPVTGTYDCRDVVSILLRHIFVDALSVPATL